MREYDVALSMGPHVKALEDSGLQVYPTEDFDEVLIRFQQTGRKSQTPMMSVERQDFSRSEAFWVFLLCEGVAVAGMGAKYTDLGSEDFEGYLRRTTAHQYPSDAKPFPTVAAPVKRVLSRRLIYLGELEIHKDFRGKASVLRSFGRLMKGLAAMKWPDFDSMYAFIPDEHFAVSRYYGFDWQYPSAISWVNAPLGRLDTHWIMGCDQDGFAHAVSVERRGLISQTQ